MRTLCVQVHRDRVPDLDMTSLCTLANCIAEKRHLVCDFRVVDDFDGEQYTNLLFETFALPSLWAEIEDVLYRDEKVGPALSQASIAICEGQDGWNDYLLLFHFDPTEQLDAFD